MGYHKVAAGVSSGVITLRQTEKSRVRKIGRASPHLLKARIELSRIEQAGHGHRRQHAGAELAILGQRAQGIEVIGDPTRPHRRRKAIANDLVDHRRKRLAVERHQSRGTAACFLRRDASRQG